MRRVEDEKWSGLARSLELSLGTFESCKSIKHLDIVIVILEAEGPPDSKDMQNLMDQLSAIEWAGEITRALNFHEDYEDDRLRGQYRGLLSALNA
jgi:hypothetical protein